MFDNYEKIIGLEIHVELLTKSKIFCSCSTTFTQIPNSQVCPICLGMPGSLPYVNEKVIELGVKAGIVLNCTINEYSKFDRKNYFYPDLPKSYQITQFYEPICKNGYLEININNTNKKIGITQIHLEEDSGKLIHKNNDNKTLIDYNRSGIALIEIVTEPHFSTAEEVNVFLLKLKELLLYLNISDCKMQEGSMRVDINLSVRKKNQSKMGTRTEMKNLNSFKSISKAIEYETKRQIEELINGNQIKQETRKWSDDIGINIPMREKKDMFGYKYFPEPNSLPILIDKKYIQNIKNRMEESAEQKRERYINKFNLTAYDAKILTSEKNLAFLFEETNEITKKPKETANIIICDILKLCNETERDIEHINISPKKLSILIDYIYLGKINRSVGKDVLEQLYLNNIDPDKYIEQNNLEIIEKKELIIGAIDIVLKNNKKSIHDYKSGKDKAFKYLMGQTMKMLKGKANPIIIDKILKEKLKM